MRSAVVLAVLAATAHADPATGEIEARLVGELDLAPRHVGKPTSLAPDVWWGAAPRWTIGLVHSDLSLDQIVPGASLCLHSTEMLVCDHVYRGSGLDVRYALADWISPRARVLLREVDPMEPAVALGAQLHWHRGRWSVVGDPYVRIGLLNTDKGNDHALYVPVQLAVDVQRWRGWLDTGWNAVFSMWRDGWHVPVGAGVRAAISREVDVGGELGFKSLLGPLNNPKERVLFLFVTTHWAP